MPFPGRLRVTQGYVLVVLFVVGATGAASADGTPPCRQTAGWRRAQVYVRQCLQVSPATHPPCNAANSCDLIIGEIERGCSMLTTDAPGFCKSYSKER